MQVRFELKNPMLFPGEGSRKRNLQIPVHHQHEVSETPTSGGASIQTTQLDPLGLRKSYCNNPRIIKCLDQINQAVEKISKGNPLDLTGVDLSPLSAIQATYSIFGHKEFLNLSFLITTISSNLGKTQYPLRSSKLIRANLSYADLRKTDLRGADLSQADLFHVDLSHADLERTNLRGVNLSHADLERANLLGADLRDANLRGVDLSNANLIGASLYAADLSYTNLTGANLINADLINAFVIDEDKMLTGQALKDYLVKKFEVIVDDGTRF